MIARAHIARAFGRAAPHYDQYADLQRQVAVELLGYVDPQLTSPAVLDLGCGTGYCSLKLREQCPASELLALDMALPMLQTVRQHGMADCALVCADAQALPLCDALFDVVVSSLTIQWCSRLDALFTELFRVARPGAQVLLSTFGPESLREVKTAWAQIDNYVHVNEFAPLAVLVEQAEAAGFSCTSKAVPVTRRYESLQAVGKELKGLGAYNMNKAQAPGFTSRKTLVMAEQAFAVDRAPEGVAVTFEILYLVLHKPIVAEGKK